MRTLIACLLLANSVAFAGQLDIAVIDFPETKTVEELNAALQGENLSQLTNSNRTMAGHAYLAGGYVKFAQILQLQQGQSFSSSTRLENTRADVSGKLGQGNVSVSIIISEGTQAGLRRFTKQVFTGSGKLPAGQPVVLSLRLFEGKSVSMVRGSGTISNTRSSTAVIAEFHK